MNLRRWLGLLVLPLFAALTAPTTATAQGVPAELDLRAGPGFPVGDLSDNADVGASFHVGLNLGVRERLGIRFEGGGDLFSGLDIPGEGRNTLRFNLVHLHAGPLLRLLEPGGSPWSLDVNGGAGISVLDIPSIEGSGEFGTVRVDVSEIYFSVIGGLGVGYELSRNVSAFLHGQATVVFADEEDTAGLPDLDPRLEVLDTIVAIPLRAGVRIRF